MAVEQCNVMAASVGYSICTDGYSRSICTDGYSRYEPMKVTTSTEMVN